MKDILGELEMFHVLGIVCVLWRETCLEFHSEVYDKLSLLFYYFDQV